MPGDPPRPLSDKLRALGVKLGTQGLPSPPSKQTPNLEQLLSGHPISTPLGETFVVDSFFSEEYQQGNVPLKKCAPCQVMATWAGDTQLSDLNPESIAYIDTETTGLSGGTGTFAFLIGAGRYKGGQFHLAQFFMRDPFEEPAQLAALEQFLAPCQAIVTFNGKAFDAPLINTRYLILGWKSPLLELKHIDLLHMSRKLWKDRLPSRTLINLEVQILGASRTEEDIPGWQIPQIYFEYLQTANPEPLRNVFYHNAMDIVSLAALFNHISAILADPGQPSSDVPIRVHPAMHVEHRIDLIALARLLEDIGDVENAAQLYLRGIETDPQSLRQPGSLGELPIEIFLNAIHRLAYIHKRQGNFALAIQLWERAASYADIPAHVELAKQYEHRNREYQAALEWTLAALRLLDTASVSRMDKIRWQPELEHRLNRIRRKLSGNEQYE